MFYHEGAANGADSIVDWTDDQNEIAVLPIIGVAEISDVDRAWGLATEKRPAYGDPSCHPPMAEYVIAYIDMLIIVIVVEPAEHHQVVAPIRNRSLTFGKLRHRRK
jgi:hypothetical protein